MKKLFFAICCLLATNGLWAADYNFSAQCSSGQTLYYGYKVNYNVDGSRDTTSVFVTYPMYNYSHYTYYDGYTKPTGDLVIPSSVSYNGKTYAITGIGWGAFYGCSGLTSVTIPNSVTSIGWKAFCGCSGLTSFTIPNSVTSIENGAFYNTGWWNNQPDGIIYKDGWCLGYKGSKPTGPLIIQEGTKRIANQAFGDSNVCTGLTSVTIPNSVISIGDYAFFGCSGLASVTIGRGITSIGEEAFGDCSGLTGTLTIPNSVTSIEGNVFLGCSGLTAINVDESNTAYKSIDGILYNKETTTLIKCPEGKTGSVTIPNSVTNIRGGAFLGCSGLTSVTIPNSVTSIGGAAFRNCRGLTSVTIPNSVTSIGQNTFSGCTGLTSVTIGNGVDSIQYSTFYGCLNLKSITIGKSVTNIGEAAFANCEAISSITCETITPPDVYYDADYYEENTFYKVDTSTVTLYVPAGSIQAYKNHAIWGKFKNISAKPIPTYTITVLANNNNIGSAMGGGTFEEGSSTSIGAIPSSGYKFVSWNDGNTQNPRQITVTENATYIATFAAEGTNTYTVSAIANNASMGNVNGGGTYTENAIVSLYAIPNSGYRFVSWSDGNTQNPRTFTVTGNMALIATFEADGTPISYTLTVLSSNNSMGSVSGGGTFEENTTITLTATPNSGYKFVSWNDGNINNPRQVTVTENATYIATFAQANATTYTLTVLSANESMGVVTGSGTYVENGTAILSAVPQAGYKFVSWNDGNTDNPRNVTVTGNATYIASFAANEGTDAIAEANGSNAQIFGGEKRIIINNAANANVAIYDVMGRTVVKEQRINTNNAVFAMPQRGMYIVRMGKAAKKVWVR